MRPGRTVRVCSRRRPGAAGRRANLRQLQACHFAGPTGVLHWLKSFLPWARIVGPASLADRQLRDALLWVERLRAS